MALDLFSPGLLGRSSKTLLDDFAQNFKSRVGGAAASSATSKPAKLSKAQRKEKKKLDRTNARRERRIRDFPDHIREAMGANPDFHGLPRLYEVRLADSGPGDSKDASMLTGCKMLFGAFGDPNSGIVFDNIAIPPENVRYCEASGIYSFHVEGARQRQAARGDAGYDGSRGVPDISGYIQFGLDVPEGHVTVGDRTLNVRLEQQPLSFDAEVATAEDAGIHMDSGEVVFDAAGDQWNNAQWDGDVEFRHRSLVFRDRPGGPIVRQLENWFVDKADPSVDVEWALTKEAEDIYSDIYSAASTTIVDTGGFAMVTDVFPEQWLIHAPAVPLQRLERDVKSVFPVHSYLRFDPYGLSFNGYYAVPDPANPFGGSLTFYAVRGSAKGLTTSRLLQSVAATTATRAQPGETASARSAASNVVLNVQNLMAMSPLVTDPNESSGFRDTCFDAALQDFYNIIIHYMEEDLRKTFVQTLPVVLPQRVREIAEDNVDENRTFYRSLQAPLIATSLARTTMDGAATINALRAEKKLTEIPADSPVFQRQFRELYTMRFKELFPDIDEYIRDSASRPLEQYDEIIAQLHHNLDTNLAFNYEVIYEGAESLSGAMATARANIDKLGSFAKQKRLFWSLELYSFLERYTVGSWFGNNSDSLRTLMRLIKALNTVFGVLEGEDASSSADGSGTDSVSFSAAFAETVMMHQMTTAVPTFIDIAGSVDEIDTLLKQILAEFLANVTENTGDETWITQREDIEALYAENEARRKLVLALASAQKTLAITSLSLGWVLMVNKAEAIAAGSKWYSRLANGSGFVKSGVAMMGVTLICLLVKMGGFEKLDGPSQALVIGGGTIMSALVLQALFRGAMDIRSFFRSVHRLGLKRVIADRWPRATRFASISLSEIGSPTPIKAQRVLGIGRYAPPKPTMRQVARARMKRIFSSTKLTTWGFISGIVSIAVVALSAVALRTATDPAEKAAHSLFIISGIASFLGVVATGLGWVGTSFALSGIASAVAMIGFIVIIVLIFTQKPAETPVEKFIRQYLEPAGLKMDDTDLAIDYLLDIPPRTGALQTQGVTIKSKSPKLSNDKERYIALAQMDVEEATEPALLTPRVSPEYSDADVWSVSTDHQGKLLIWTTRYVRQPPPVTEDGETAPGPVDESDPLAAVGDLNNYTTETWLLGPPASGSAGPVVLAKLPAANDADAAQKLEALRWDVEVADSNKIDYPEEEDDENDELEEKPFQSLTMAECKIFKGSLVLTPHITSGSVVDGFRAESGSDCRWQLQLAPKFPLSFNFEHNPWVLSTTATNQQNQMQMTPFTTSLGFDWSVSPTLPSPFSLVSEFGIDEGFIRMQEGVALPAAGMPPTEYVVTCSQSKPDGTNFTRTRALVIEVKTEEQFVSEVQED